MNACGLLDALATCRALAIVLTWSCSAGAHAVKLSSTRPCGAVTWPEEPYHRQLSARPPTSSYLSENCELGPRQFRRGRLGVERRCGGTLAWLACVRACGAAGRLRPRPGRGRCPGSRRRCKGCSPLEYSRQIGRAVADHEELVAVQEACVSIGRELSQDTQPSAPAAQHGVTRARGLPPEPRAGALRACSQPGRAARRGARAQRGLTQPAVLVAVCVDAIVVRGGLVGRPQWRREVAVRHLCAPRRGGVGAGRGWHCRSAQGQSTASQLRPAGQRATRRACGCDAAALARPTRAAAS